MLQSGKVEYITVSRLESQRLRMRKVTDNGTDLVLNISERACLNDGDVVFMTREKMVVVKRELESVALITLHSCLSDDNLLAIAVKVGHAIGNLHRPVRIEGNSIYFPILSESEIELFEKQFRDIRDHVEIKVDQIVFQVEPGSNLLEQHKNKY